MLLKNLLSDTTKADLQGFYLYWLPEREMCSSREKLALELHDEMMNQERVRARFDGLGRPHRAFVLALLGRKRYEGTVDEIRAELAGRVIEQFEVEPTLKTLLGEGLVFRVPGNGRNKGTSYFIPREIGNALRRTVSLEERDAAEILGRARDGAWLDGRRPAKLVDLVSKLDGVGEHRLRELLERAMEDGSGILTFTRAVAEGLLPGGRLREGWRDALEAAGVGTIGVLDLKPFGIGLEEEALVVDQDLVYRIAIQKALAPSVAEGQSPGVEVEVRVGTDFMADIDRFLEVVRTEPPDVTREKKLYKKTVERLSTVLMTSRHDDCLGGNAVREVFEICRRLRLVSLESQKVTGDPLRRRAWQSRPIDSRSRAIFEIFRADRSGAHWSFHQEELREIFLEQLKALRPGAWLDARALVNAAMARYLLSLGDLRVREEYRSRCEDDAPGEAQIAPFEWLQRDLLHWTLWRLARIGLLDTGFSGGAFRYARLSRLGLRFFGLLEESEEGDEKPLLVNPDFEVLAFPGGRQREETLLMLTRFADHVGSDRVRRYRLTRESLKRGVVSGLKAPEILEFLEDHSRAPVPENVEYSLREWSEGVEPVRRQRALLLRAASADGCERLVSILQQREVHCERLSDTVIAVRGSRNEKAVRDLGEVFRKHGLFLE